MFDFDAIANDMNQKFSFSADAYMPDGQWYILNDVDTKLGYYLEDSNTIHPYGTLDSETQEEIMNAFNKFVGGPVYAMYKANKLIYTLISNPTFDVTYASDLYKNLIIGSAIVLYGISDGIKYAKKFLTWLDTTDFYQAPASAKYHDAYDGGLLRHSLTVVYHITELIHVSSFNEVNIASAILVALVHDLCKINLYEPYMKNVKDDVSQTWVQVQAYKYRDAMIPLGHGVSSLYIVQKFFKLDLEQALAIRWHMGRWNLCDGESAEYHAAVKSYPLVYMLQFADQLSITSY